MNRFRALFSHRSRLERILEEEIKEISRYEAAWKALKASFIASNKVWEPNELLDHMTYLELEYLVYESKFDPLDEVLRSLGD